MNNEEKILAILEQLQQGQATTNKRLNSLEESLQVVRTSQMKVELEQFPKIAAALEGAIGGNEKNKEQDGRILILENKTEDNGHRIFALEQVVKAQ